jgi:hypothetical protein
MADGKARRLTVPAAAPGPADGKWAGRRSLAGMAHADFATVGIANAAPCAQIFGKAHGGVLDVRALRTGRFIKGEDR